MITPVLLKRAGFKQYSTQQWVVFSLFNLIQDSVSIICTLILQHQRYYPCQIFREYYRFMIQDFFKSLFVNSNTKWSPKQKTNNIPEFMYVKDSEYFDMRNWFSGKKNLNTPEIINNPSKAMLHARNKGAIWQDTPIRFNCTKPIQTLV